MALTPLLLPFFFFHATATTQIYTLSLHDALPIYDTGLTNIINLPSSVLPGGVVVNTTAGYTFSGSGGITGSRSEEHTSELQSHSDLVCRLLLEKKKKEQETDAVRKVSR